MTVDDGKEQEIQPEITVSEDIKRGVFANHTVVNHGSEEFLLEFLYLSNIGGTVSSRVILTPSHFKRLIRAMQQNLESYERRFGEVPYEVKERAPQ